MRARTRCAAVTAGLALLAAGCGGGDDDGDGGGTPLAGGASAAAQAPADPKAEWVEAMNGLCTQLAGEVSGMQQQARLSGYVLTPAEHLDLAERGRPAVELFDAAAAALPVPAEAQEARKAWDAYLALRAASLPALDAAAKAGDQAALNKAVAAREAEALAAPQAKALKTHGLGDSCTYRGSYA